VLVYAFHGDSTDHAAYEAWLREALESEEPFGLSELVLSGVIRLVTSRKVFDVPAPVETALAFAASLRSHPNALIQRPGPRHWEIFERLCHDVNAKANVVPDAYHAALAIESGSEWVTTDRGFARFQGLRWRHPLASR